MSEASELAKKREKIRRTTGTRAEPNAETTYQAKRPPTELMARIRLKRARAWALLRQTLTSINKLDTKQRGYSLQFGSKTRYVIGLESRKTIAETTKAYDQHGQFYGIFPSVYKFAQAAKGLLGIRRQFLLQYSVKLERHCSITKGKRSFISTLLRCGGVA